MEIVQKKILYQLIIGGAVVGGLWQTASAGEFSHSGYAYSKAASNNNLPIYLAQAENVVDDDLSLGQEADEVFKGQEATTGATLFGKGGYLHPALSLSSEYSDNVFNKPPEQTVGGDIKSRVTPSVWFSVPASRAKLLKMDTSNTAPGGFSANRKAKIYTQRYQSYLFYQPEFVLYDKNSSADTVNHTLDALFQYNLKSGLSFDLANQYKDSEDPASTGISTTIDEFKTNIFDAKLNYYISQLLDTQLGYANVNVDYDAAANDAKDRTDNAYSANIYYHFKPKKLEFSAGYKFVNVDYDFLINSDSDMHYFLGGVDWSITPKTSLKLNAGYVTKEFDEAGSNDTDDLVFDVTGDLKFSDKTALTLKAARELKESDVPGVDFTLGHKFSASLSQKFTKQFSAKLDVSTTRDQYHGQTTAGGLTMEKKDLKHKFSPSLSYKFNEWVTGGLTYTFEKRDSNFPTNDYENESGMVKLDTVF